MDSRDASFPAKMTISDVAFSLFAAQGGAATAECPRRGAGAVRLVVSTAVALMASDL
jgi:hypothetical protein